MPRKTIVVVTCDKCHEEINVTMNYVSAMVYGATFHMLCWEGINGTEVAKFLGLDDIDIYKNDERVKRIY